MCESGRWFVARKKSKAYTRSEVSWGAGWCRDPVTEFGREESARDVLYNVNNTVIGVAWRNIGAGIDPPCPPVRQLP